MPASRNFAGDSCFLIFVKPLHDHGFMKCSPCEIGFVDFGSMTLSLECFVHNEEAIEITYPATFDLVPKWV